MRIILYHHYRRACYFALVSGLARVRLELLQASAPLEMMLGSAWTLLQMDLDEIYAAWIDGSWEFRMLSSPYVQRMAYFMLMVCLIRARMEFQYPLAPAAATVEFTGAEYHTQGKSRTNGGR